jgi:hypothetical protein
MVGRVLAGYWSNAEDHQASDIPWHRVVRADGSAPVGAPQLKLLPKEGAPMLGDRVDLRPAGRPWQRRALKAAFDRGIRSWLRCSTDRGEHRPHGGDDHHREPCSD